MHSRYIKNHITNSFCYGLHTHYCCGSSQIYYCWLKHGTDPDTQNALARLVNQILHTAVHHQHIPIATYLNCRLVRVRLISFGGWGWSGSQGGVVKIVGSDTEPCSSSSWTCRHTEYSVPGLRSSILIHTDKLQL